MPALSEENTNGSSGSSDGDSFVSATTLELGREDAGGPVQGSQAKGSLKYLKDMNLNGLVSICADFKSRTDFHDLLWFAEDTDDAWYDRVIAEARMHRVFPTFERYINDKYQMAPGEWMFGSPSGDSMLEDLTDFLVFLVTDQETMVQKAKESEQHLESVSTPTHVQTPKTNIPSPEPSPSPTSSKRQAHLKSFFPYGGCGMTKQDSRFCCASKCRHGGYDAPSADMFPPQPKIHTVQDVMSWAHDYNDTIEKVLPEGALQYLADRLCTSTYSTAFSGIDCPGSATPKHFIGLHSLIEMNEDA